jgi:hypothetical protein
MVALLLLIIPSSVFAVEPEKEGLFRDHLIQPQKNRIAINENFAPDESCMFDAYQLKCVPGAEQECPEGFAQNEDPTCWFEHDICPEGYLTVDDDETGKCYNDVSCVDSYLVTNDTRFNYVFLEDERRCANPSYLCEEPADHLVCKEYLEAVESQRRSFLENTKQN